MSIPARGANLTTVYDEGVEVTFSPELNFTGAGVSAAYNAGTGRIDITIPAGGVTDHGALTGLADDDHTQYALLLGRAGGQDLAGGNAINETLTLRGTSAGAPGADIVNISALHLDLAATTDIRDSTGRRRIFLQNVNPHITLNANANVGAVYCNIGTALTVGGFGAGIAPNVFAYAVVGNQGSSVDGKMGLQVDMGLSSSAAGSTVIGISGRAIVRDAGSTTSYGLDYLAGSQGRSIATAGGARTQAFISGAGITVTDYAGFTAKGGTLILGALTNWYGFKTDAATIGTNRLPFWDNVGLAGDLSGNRFRTNTAFGTVATVGLFGGGDGVIHIHDATTVPTTNPTLGGIVYNVGGATYHRSPSGVVTTLAPA